MDPAWVYTVYLCVKQRNKIITMFSNVKNLPLAPQYRKRLLQICTVTARNIHNVTTPAQHVTTSDLQVLWGLKHGMDG